jgi:hypothetical protein
VAYGSGANAGDKNKLFAPTLRSILRLRLHHFECAWENKKILRIFEIIELAENRLQNPSFKGLRFENT